MKIKVIAVIGGAIILLFAGLLLFHNWGNTNEESIEGKKLENIEKDYAQLRKKIENNQMDGSSKENISEYTNLFKKIANGDQKYTAEYARLLTEITNDTYKFNDDEVFGIAKDIAELYEQMEQGTDDFGIQAIKIVSSDQEKWLLAIDYINLYTYSVKAKNKSEPVLVGEKFLASDALGEYQMEIIFDDTKASRRFAEQYHAGEIYPLQEIPGDLETGFRMMVSYPDTHSVIVYIGSDVPLHIEEQENNKINRPKGVLELAIER